MAYETITIDNYSEVKEKLYETIIESPSGRQKVMRSGGELLQMIGSEALRNQVDSDFWVKAGVRSILGKRSVSDDTRYLNEAEALRGRGWVIVRITAPEDVRKTRIKGAFRPTNHSSETEQKFIAEDYTLDNSGDRTIEDVMTELVSYLRSVDNSFMAKTQRALSDGVI